MKWAEGRHVIIRGDILGTDFDPDSLDILNTPERRALADKALDQVITWSKEEEGPMWARGLDDNEVLDPEGLLAQADAGSSPRDGEAQED